jgi:HEPN domain-containing protein
MNHEAGLQLYTIAKEDHEALLILLASPASLSISCFHAQQAVEKYLKAVLSTHGIRYPFTHDLLELSGFLADNAITLPVADEQLEKLNPFAVKQRYDRPPLVKVTREEVKEIVDLIANWCEKQLHDR